MAMPAGTPNWFERLRELWSVATVTSGTPPCAWAALLVNKTSPINRMHEFASMRRKPSRRKVQFTRGKGWVGAIRMLSAQSRLDVWFLQSGGHEISIRKTLNRQGMFITKATLPGGTANCKSTPFAPCVCGAAAHCPNLKGIGVARFYRRSGLESRRRGSSDQGF